MFKFRINAFCEVDNIDANNVLTDTLHCTNSYVNISINNSEEKSVKCTDAESDSKMNNAIFSTQWMQRAIDAVNYNSE